jgi:hypothetical protein
MAVRDLLWGCPLCRAPGGIRPDGRRERCRACGAEFRRGRGSTIVAKIEGSSRVRSAGDWLSILGPVEAPRADADGLILGPERVRVKRSRRQNPLRYAGELLGWVELYDKAQRGTMSLRSDGLHFQPEEGPAVSWAPGDLTGLQPASSSLQLGLHREMASVKFLEGSVRLWTRALSDLLREHYRRSGRDVLELQPFVRTCILQGAPRE